MKGPPGAGRGEWRPNESAAPEARIGRRLRFLLWGNKPPLPREAWRPVAVAAPVVFLLFVPTFVWLGLTWATNPVFSHGFIVPVFAAFLAARAVRRLPAVDRSLAYPAGVAVAVLGFGVYLAGLYLADPIVTATSFLVLLLSFAILLLGPLGGGRLLGPIAFLAFAIPFPEVSAWSVTLQNVTTSGAQAVLTATGLHTYRSDFDLTAGAVTYQIGPLCSGLSSLLGLGTLATFLAAVSPMGWWRRALVAFSSLPLAIIANLVRVVATFEIGLHWGVPASEGFVHESSDTLLFLAALIPVVALWLTLGGSPGGRSHA